jgi:hypothetical protein
MTREDPPVFTTTIAKSLKPIRQDEKEKTIQISECLKNYLLVKQRRTSPLLHVPKPKLRIKQIKPMRPKARGLVQHDGPPG